MQKIVDYNKNYLKDISIKNNIIFVILIFILLISVLNKIYYEKYYIDNGVVVETNLVRIYVDEENLSIINNNNKIKIENKFFAYKVNSINELEYLNKKYYQLLINIKLDEKHNIKNNNFKFKIIVSKEKILKYILNKLGV